MGSSSAANELPLSAINNYVVSRGEISHDTSTVVAELGAAAYVFGVAWANQHPWLATGHTDSSFVIWNTEAW